MSDGGAGRPGADSTCVGRSGKHAAHLWTATAGKTGAFSKPSSVRKDLINYDAESRPARNLLTTHSASLPSSS